MNTRFITMAILHLIAMTLIACTSGIEKNRIENTVAPVRKYKVEDVRTYEFVPPGAPHMMCVMQPQEVWKGGGLACFPAKDVK